MNKALPAPRTELNKWAPRIESIQIPKDKIGEVIGPKGKVIRELEEKTGASIEIEEEGGFGLVRIASSDSEALAAAKERIMNIVFPPEAEMNKEYDGEVVNITKFGAFVNILPGRDGLLHISKLDDSRRVERVEDYLDLGQKIGVIVEEIDGRTGKLALKLARPLEGVPKEGAPSVSDGGGRDDRPRDRDRDRDRPRNGDRGGDRGRSGGSDRPRGGSRDERPRDRDRSERPSAPPREPASASAPEGGEPRRRAAVSFEDAFEDMKKD
jgi:polyribonucleotide nucleotidyltransferase